MLEENERAEISITCYVVRMGTRLVALSLAFVSACSGRACFKENFGGPPDVAGGDAGTPLMASAVPTSTSTSTPTSTSTSTSTSTAALGPTDCEHRGAGMDYTVGPGKKYATIGDVPFEKLKAGDTVRIFWRTAPYREKMMIGGVGTAEQPIRVCGVPGPKGELPVIDGENATTRKELLFPYDGHQVRGLVTIGHKNGDPPEIAPKHIVVEGLDIRNGTPPFTFTDRSGNVKAYSANASGIFVQRAQHVTIRGCTVTNNNNGIYVGTTGGAELTQDVLIEKNHVYGNGSTTTYYMHNVYNEASNVTYQYNYFGSPRFGVDGVQGANIKERSAGVVIRYNWIEDGAHLLDLVDAQEAKDSTVKMPTFHTTYVYGNVLVRAKSLGSIVHYGGDSGALGDYRKGTLFFYDNTVVVKNSDYADWSWTGVFEISTNDERLDARNNIFYSTVAPAQNRGIAMLAPRDQNVSGIASFAGNWVTDDWVPHTPKGGRNAIVAELKGFEASKRGTNPGFVDAAAGAYELTKGAAARGVGVPLPADYVPPEHIVRQQYARHQAGRPRVLAAPPTAGAFED